MFDLEQRYQRLSETRDPLVKFAALIDFEVFRTRLTSALRRPDGSKGGRPSYDPVLMFKIMVLQTLYTLSDNATEFPIRDRLSFMRFVRLGLEDRVPDARTIWLFREQLTRAGAIMALFAEFDTWLKRQGFLMMSGQIIDASIIAAPCQVGNEDKMTSLKEGRIPDEWTAQSGKLAQKERDARRTLKRVKARKTGPDGRKTKIEIAIPVFGSMDRISIDRAHGFVRRLTVTNAVVYDEARLSAMLDKTNTASAVLANTAYRSAANETYLERIGFQSRTLFRRRQGADLTAAQKSASRGAVAVTLGRGHDAWCREACVLPVHPDNWCGRAVTKNAVSQCYQQFKAISPDHSQTHDRIISTQQRFNAIEESRHQALPCDVNTVPSAILIADSAHEARVIREVQWLH